MNMVDLGWRVERWSDRIRNEERRTGRNEGTASKTPGTSQPQEEDSNDPEVALYGRGYVGP